jgi:hypothetical protein
MSGDLSLFKYFDSYCKIKRKCSTGSSMKHFSLYDYFELIIYTNIRIESNSALQGADSDPVSVLSSGTNCVKCITLMKLLIQIFLNFLRRSQSFTALL